MRASHGVWIGNAGWKDWELKQVILEQDWVLVPLPKEKTFVGHLTQRDGKG